MDKDLYYGLILDKYLDIIRSEFSKSTIQEDEENVILNIRGRVPMDIKDIEYGIELGKQIIANQNNKENTGFELNN